MHTQRTYRFAHNPFGLVDLPHDRRDIVSKGIQSIGRLRLEIVNDGRLVTLGFACTGSGVRSTFLDLLGLGHGFCRFRDGLFESWLLAAKISEQFFVLCDQFSQTSDLWVLVDFIGGRRLDLGFVCRYFVGLGSDSIFAIFYVALKISGMTSVVRTVNSAISSFAFSRSLRWLFRFALTGASLAVKPLMILSSSSS